MKTNFILFFGLGLLVSVLLCQCATPSSPSGGPRDETPPVLDTMKSSPLMPVFFDQKEILLEFDEFVELSNPATSVVVSPPLQHRLDFQVRGRRVIVSLDDREELRANTTYTINFGDAIRDFTEGNVVRNFIYVFSTGPVIDSLDFAVRLIDAYTGQPIDNGLALFHPVGRDSAVFKDKPSYFAASGEDGLARLQFMREGEYALFALKDENRNYILDLPSELVGWYEGTVVLPDTAGFIPEIRMFKRDERLVATSRRWQDAGRLAVKFNRRSDAVEVEFPQLSMQPLRTFSADTLIYHFTDGIIRDSLSMVVSLPPDIRDTLAMRPSRDTLRSPLRMTSHSQNVPPGQRARLVFNQIISDIDTARIQQFRADTLFPDGHGIREWDTENNQWKFNVSLEPGQTANWLLLPGAVTDLFGQTNDSIRFSLNRQSANAFSNLKLNIENLDTSIQYIFVLENRSGEVMRKIADNVESFLWDLKYIRPDNYTLRVIEDANFNRRWDPGDILRKRQPERISIHKLVELRANWDFEQTVEPFQENNRQ